MNKLKTADDTNVKRKSVDVPEFIYKANYTITLMFA